MTDLPKFALPSSRVPSEQARAQFRETIKLLPIGTKVVGNADLAAKLGKSRAGRPRDMDMVGMVEGYDDLQLRVLVRWGHPDFKDKPVSPGNLEPLPPYYLDIVKES